MSRKRPSVLRWFFVILSGPFDPLITHLHKHICKEGRPSRVPKCLHSLCAYVSLLLTLCSRALRVPITSQMLSDILSRLVETIAEQGEDMQVRTENCILGTFVTPRD